MPALLDSPPAFSHHPRVTSDFQTFDEIFLSGNITAQLHARFTQP